MLPDTVVHFPKPKAEGNKNEIIHSFVLEEHLWLTAYAALSFRWVSKSSFSILLYLGLTAQSKAMFL